jgi:NAD(P)-dependent dehydrogenase (short-subunit alcohol dehydrogenase family)
VIDQVRLGCGRIDVLLHAAGIERSHFLPDKDPREFDLVFDVKADGYFNLLHAIGDMPLGATVAFSSIAGRFGGAGSNRLQFGQRPVVQDHFELPYGSPPHTWHRH